MGHILFELKAVIAKWGDQVKFIRFADDEFLSAGRTYLEEFSRRYKEEIGVPFRCLGHPNNVTKEVLELLLDAGMTHFQMGIQTCSNSTGKLYNRTISNEKILEAVTTLSQYKNRLFPSYDFIIDNPYEDLSHLGETIRFITQFPRPFNLAVFPLILFPGTRLYQRAVEDGLIAPDDTKHFTKKFQDYNYTKRYANIVFMLLKYNIPAPLMRALASERMLRCFDRPFFTSIFIKIHTIWQLRKKVSRRVLIRP